MTGTSDTGGSILGATSGVAGAVAGVSTLPNTGGNTLVTIFSIVAFVAGALVVASFVTTRLAARIIK